MAEESCSSYGNTREVGSGVVVKSFYSKHQKKLLSIRLIVSDWSSYCQCERAMHTVKSDKELHFMPKFE